MAAALAALMAASLAAAGGWVWLHPLKAHSLHVRHLLWRGGARRVSVGGLTGFRKDTCGGEKTCRCVALIHGLGDDATAWRRILVGDTESGPPPRGFRLYALNLPATDGSRPPEDMDGFRPRSQAKILRSALAEACPEWTVVGNSLGGWIASWLALDWPEGVKDLVLIGAAGLSDPSGASREAARILTDPTSEGLKALHGRTYYRPAKAPPRVWIELAERLRARKTTAVISSITNEDFLDRDISRLAIPVRIIWGEADKVVPVAQGKEFHRLIKGSVFTAVAECGHIPQKECPGPVRRAVFR
ncbi:MAG: alpha/beta hydrolase [Elusimicrobiota bacterium]